MKNEQGAGSGVTTQRKSAGRASGFVEKIADPRAEADGSE